MSQLLQVQNLVTAYPIQGGFFGKKIGEVRAVNDVSFSIAKGEIVGLVGESGCGKSTLGKSVLRLIEPSSGSLIYDGKNLVGMPPEELRKARRRMQMIFQDPFSSLNPRMRVGTILSEPFIIHDLCPKTEIRSKVMELLSIVGLRPESYDKFPHEFSGGQRQRIGIARALAVRPDFIVADEPVSALDVSIQSQILNLLRKLREDFNLTYLFISHDLNVIRYLCDRVIVMYLGRVMEILERDQLTNPHFDFHPYTKALLSAAPRKHPDAQRDFIPLTGDIPSPARPPSGCVFHPRCQEAVPECSAELPILKSLDSSGHSVACHLRPRKESRAS